MCELLTYAIASELASICASDYVLVLLALEVLVDLQVVICSSMKLSLKVFFKLSIET